MHREEPGTKLSELVNTGWAATGVVRLVSPCHAVAMKSGLPGPRPGRAQNTLPYAAGRVRRDPPRSQLVAAPPGCQWARAGPGPGGVPGGGPVLGPPTGRRTDLGPGRKMRAAPLQRVQVAELAPPARLLAESWRSFPGGCAAPEDKRNSPLNGPGPDPHMPIGPRNPSGRPRGFPPGAHEGGEPTLRPAPTAHLRRRW
jgi:hypothetical protein